MSLAVTSLRVAIGVLFLVAGLAELAGHDASARAFGHWGIPAPGAAVWAIASTEIVCGALFALGILTRPVGLLLATVMVGAALTMGRTDGGFGLVVPILVFCACVYTTWRSDRLRGIAPSRRPGVQ
jgi:uncharacterized membrane protein YphA (DoxX/SURF4 family)